jgi:nitrogen fixation NifU-like protein
MTDIRELYQEVILDHNRAPRNFRKLEPADRVQEGQNPLCGDEFTLYLKLEGDVIDDVGFQGHGCAISKASASLMTVNVKGKTVEQAETLFDHVHEMLTEGADDPDALGSIAALSGVRAFPTRVKCATLAWHTLKGALEGESSIVSTEKPNE